MAYKIYLYDNEYDGIGTGCLSADYIQFQLQMANGDDIEVHISSCGGDAFAAVAIYNLLKSYVGKVTTYIDSVAASAAATIAMAGSTVVMSKYALLMIHKPSLFTGGNADEITADIAMLDAIQTNIVSIYVDKTGLERDKIESLVNATTWLTADEAKALNFVDEIQDHNADNEVIKNASLVTNYVQAAPARYKQVINKILIKPAPEPQPQNTMTKEEKQSLLDEIKGAIKKVTNFFKPSLKKVTTNKGEVFVLNTVAVGSPVFNDADMDSDAEDAVDLEITDDEGKKAKMTVKDGKISNIEQEGDEDDDDNTDEDDDEFDPENKVVLNSVGINFKKSVGNKVVKNAMAAKLKEVTNRAAQQDALIIDLKKQLEVSNAAVIKDREEIKNEIKSDFKPDASSSRSTKVGVKEESPSFMPKEGTLAGNVVKSVMSKAKK